MKANSFVADRLMACLPPGVPASYREITSARFEGTGANRMAVADLIMIDGLPAKVQVSTWGLMPHRFTHLPGGHLTFEDGRWIRIDHDTLEPFPAQGELFPAQPSTKEGDA